MNRGSGVAAGLTGGLRAMLGLGLLVVPAALGPVAADRTLPLLVAVPALWCLLVAARGGTTSAGGATARAAARLGRPAERLVHRLYLLGFACGQGAVALTAAALLLGPAAPAALLPPVAALLLAVAALRSGPALRPGLRGPRLYAVVAAAAALWAVGALHPGAAAPVAALPLLFLWVGLEDAVPPLRERGRLLGTLLAVLLAGLAGALLLSPSPFSPQQLPAAVPLFARLLAAALCVSHCRTNLRAVSLRWAAFRGAPRWQGAALGATVAALTLPLGLLPGGAALVLLGPGAATAALFLIFLTAALRRRPSAQLPPTEGVLTS